MEMLRALLADKEVIEMFICDSKDLFHKEPGNIYTNSLGKLAQVGTKIIDEKLMEIIHSAGAEAMLAVYYMVMKSILLIPFYFVIDK
jgi:hypothetical protein